MAVVLAYVDAVPGRLYPLVPTLLELARRDHRVAVRCGADQVELLRSIGIPAESIAREIERFEPGSPRRLSHTACRSSRFRSGATNRRSLGAWRFRARASVCPCGS